MIKDTMIHIDQEYGHNIKHNRCSSANEKQSLYIFFLSIKLNPQKIKKKMSIYCINNEFSGNNFVIAFLNRSIDK